MVRERSKCAHGGGIKKGEERSMRKPDWIVYENLIG
jgi:hypothetical protein